MDKKELMARVEELRKAEAEEMLNTVLVDVHISVDRKAIAELMTAIAEAIGMKCKFMVDLINPYTPEAKRAKAIMAIRLSKVPHTIIIVTNEAKDVVNWVKTYTEKGIKTYVYLTDQDRFYEAEDYLDMFEKELLLDTVMKTRHSQDRALLEEIAESFAAALGWTFSGPIKEQALTPNFLDKFQPKTILPYAGWKGNYSFAASIHQFNDTLVEEVDLQGKFTITPSHRTKLLVGKSCQTEELEQFRDYLMALIDANLLEEALEDGWTLCLCGHPVRQFGPIDAATCPYCDLEIKDYYCTDVDMPYYLYQVYEIGRRYKKEHPYAKSAKAILRKELKLKR